jgi:hypothetical protein
MTVAPKFLSTLESLPMSQHTCIAIATLVFLSCAAGAAKPTTVGVLEAPQCLEPAQVGVRPLFVKTNAGWQAADADHTRSLSTATQWTLALDGRMVGTLSTDGMLADTPLLALAAKQTLPQVANAQQRFGGWCSTPERRPLAASSTGAFADPDQWKPYSPTAKQAQALLSQYQAAVGASVTTCEGETTRPWHYDATDLTAVGGFQDNKGRQIVGVSLDASKNQCDGPPEEGWQPQWFVLGEAVRFIGSNLDLVEAVDFDADGASELLLWRTDYNQDGYLLLDSTLQTTQTVQWSYH